MISNITPKELKENSESFQKVRKQIGDRRINLQNNDMKLALLLEKVRREKDKYFPNNDFNTFEHFVEKGCGCTVPTMNSYIRSGRLFQVIKRFNKTLTDEEKLPLPFKITDLRSIPFTGPDWTKNAVAIWKIALENANGILPTVGIVTEAKEEFFRKKSNILTFI